MTTKSTTLQAVAAPTLRLSTNRKTCTTARLKPSGQWAPVPNSVGFSRETCTPHLTEICESCYAAKLERIYPAIGRVMRDNYAAIAPYRGKPAQLAELFAVLLDQSAAAQRLAGVTQPTFRWQWDGELAFPAHAQAISRAHEMRPDIAGWVYTRAHRWAHYFRMRETGAPPENLAVFLSVDRDNLRSARRAAARYEWLRYAFTGDSWDECNELAAKMTEPRGLKCPELTGRVPLNSEGTGAGACTVCAHCLPNGRGNVRFSTGKDSPR